MGIYGDWCLKSQNDLNNQNNFHFMSLVQNGF